MRGILRAFDRIARHIAASYPGTVPQPLEAKPRAVGDRDGSEVHAEVFGDVIADRAAAVIFAHNHPSCDLRPSDADLRMHNQLVDAAKTLGLRVLDHVIVGKKGYFSFQEWGLVM